MNIQIAWQKVAIIKKMEKTCQQWRKWRIWLKIAIGVALMSKTAKGFPLRIVFWRK